MTKLAVILVIILGSCFTAKFQKSAELDDFINSNFVAYPLRGISDSEVDFLYNEYLQIWGKTSSKFGFSHFHQSLLRIIKHNKKNSSWEKGLNQFSDMSYYDFEQQFLMRTPQNCSATAFNYEMKNIDLPSSVDWRKKGIVSPVKSQGRCGSCWTFSTTGCLEAHWKLHKGGEFLDLSEQQLVDCAGDFDNHGCNGGLPSHAFEYIKHVGGIQQEKDYPYKAETLSCHFDKSKVVAHVSGGAVNITAGSEHELDEALATVGPVSIAFEVVDDFRDYKSGVYQSKTCKNGPMDVNHAVLAVGYGVEKGVKYYIVKNSWGAVWGDQGFFKIKRGVNMCGVAVCNSYPKLEAKKTNANEI